MTNTTKQNLEKARKLFELKEYNKSEKLYLDIRKSIRDSKEKAIVWAELSWLYYHTKRYEKAIEAADSVLINDDNYEAKENLFRIQGYSYLGLKKNTMAAQYLKLSLEQNSIIAEQQYVKYELGKLYFKNGDYDLSLPYLEDIRYFFQTEKMEYHLSVLFFLGFTYYYLESFIKAQKCFEEILAANPDSQRYASASFGIAYIEFEKKNYLEVISLCEKIISVDANFFDKESVGFLTAASYFYLGRHDIFNAYYNKMIQNYPSGRYSKELEKLKHQQKSS